MSRAERTLLPRIGATQLSSTLFEFLTESRMQCQVTHQVRYNSTNRQSASNTLELRIPLEAAINQEEVETAERLKKARVESGAAAAAAPGGDGETKPIVPFEACLETFFGNEIVELRNPSLGAIVPTLKTVRLKTFPRYLMVKLGRYYPGPNWVQVSSGDFPTMFILSRYPFIHIRCFSTLSDQD